ncbi:arabinose-5-phosphate isomerase [Palleronia aestuarii]|uniref:Arabinose-5-phosphate isomerase n=1 Tax=Palleronia aestuarii TaxID=568105 RepID=A0A2W7NSV5_9RHOB|nr:KpsF/GutQ family sugar-phosphate isomerase [Palleronia aestuarii]PZX14332.1 arabinose-5-phosphate isomerase [Palleronia aestuarii]
MTATPSTGDHDDRDTVEEALRVLRIEADALHRLARELPADFAAAVDLILQARGRVVVSGVGKSGHVGRKIAATLASTGTPAQFVHATEASHGDMGMIGCDDVCLLLSNSGETGELNDLVAYSRRFRVPLIAISSRPTSTLMRAADLRLTLPDAPEACAIGMAPTTSTTLALALGDALAVALMRRRAFTPDHFRVFHPGGRLGARVATVAQLMRTGAALPLVGHETPMDETLLVMTSKSLGLAIVVEEGRLAGVISDGDLRRNMAGLLERRAGDIASLTPATVGADQLAAEALALMTERKITALPVVEGDGQVVGVVHVQDCLNAGLA